MEIVKIFFTKKHSTLNTFIQVAVWIDVDISCAHQVRTGTSTHISHWLIQQRSLLVQFSCSVVSDSLWIPWITARQASLSITNSWSLPKLMSIELVMPSNHLILCHPLLLLPSIFPNIRVFSNESALCIRWPKCWSFSFNISPSNEHPGLISFRMDWLDLLQSKGLSRVFFNTIV